MRRSQWDGAILNHNANHHQCDDIASIVGFGGGFRMRPAVFDVLLRWFLRVQATMAVYPMAALLLADRNAQAAFFWAAVATDVARWALSRFRWLPVAVGATLICGSLALFVLAVAGGAVSPPLPAPVPGHARAPLFDPRSGLLSGVEEAGGRGFLFSLLVAMSMGQAGVFLAFAGERSAYVRRHMGTERPERLSLLNVVVPFALQLFLLWVPIFALWAGLLTQGSPPDPAAALGQIAWRIVTVQRFLIPSAAVGAAAIVAWLALNAIAMHRESRRGKASKLAETQLAMSEGTAGPA